MGGGVSFTGKMLAAGMVADAATGGSTWKSVGCFMVLWTLFVLAMLVGGGVWFVMWIFS